MVKYKQEVMNDLRSLGINAVTRYKITDPEIVDEYQAMVEENVKQAPIHDLKVLKQGLPENIQIQMKRLDSFSVREIEKHHKKEGVYPENIIVYEDLVSNTKKYYDKQSIIFMGVQHPDDSDVELLLQIHQAKSLKTIKLILIFFLVLVLLWLILLLILGPAALGLSV